MSRRGKMIRRIRRLYWDIKWAIKRRLMPKPERTYNVTTEKVDEIMKELWVPAIKEHYEKESIFVKALKENK